MQAVVLIIIVLIIMFFIEKKLKKNKTEKRQALHKICHADYLDVYNTFGIHCFRDIREMSLLDRFKLLFKPKLKKERYFYFGKNTRYIIYKKYKGNNVLMKYDKGTNDFS